MKRSLNAGDCKKNYMAARKLLDDGDRYWTATVANYLYPKEDSMSMEDYIDETLRIVCLVHDITAEDIDWAINTPWPTMKSKSKHSGILVGGTAIGNGYYLFDDKNEILDLNKT